MNAGVWFSLAAVAGIMGALLFGFAGRIDYPKAWAYLAVYVACSVLITLYLARADPALLQRRMRGGPLAEQEPTQRLIMAFASAGFVASLVVPALECRFGCSRAPLAVAVAGDVIVAASFYGIFRVFQANSFAASTIGVAAGQHVISTEPYAIVRHPMYAFGGLLFVGTPLALGSYWGLLAFVAVLPVLIWRLLDEERFLAANLPGYVAYCARVRWRLLPGVF